MSNKKVFLGGTCCESDWRDKLIPLLKIDYFNPVVSDWNEDCMKEEIRQREICDFCLYVITPRMQGVYSIAEAVDDSNKRPEKTVFCILDKDNNPLRDINNSYNIPHYISFTNSQMKSLRQVAKMIECNGGKYFDNLIDVANFLNNN